MNKNRLIIHQLLDSNVAHVQGVPVASMVDLNGDWNWQLFQHMLPHHVLLRIAAIRAPLPLLGADNVGWRGGIMDRFSVKAAYKVRMADTPQVTDKVWEIIHKHRGLQRIRVFLWLVCRNKIMTNVERGRRQLTTDTYCPVCNSYPEDVDHVLRSCASTAAVWCSIIKSDKVNEFFSLSISEWIVINLTKPDYFVSHEAEWDILFGALVWYFWKARNALVFNGAVEVNRSILELSRQLRDVAVRALVLQQSNQVVSTPLMRSPVEWTPPEQGWVKLNTDGAPHAISGMASCGGVFRDHMGEWILGFSKFIGVCSVVDAELWGVLVGLESAWSHGFRKIIIETDSLDVCRLLRSDNHSQQGLSLLMHLNRLRHQD
ncbi:hypothetical protein GQ457_09G012620 [Hibiscus cannabinus]